MPFRYAIGPEPRRGEIERALRDFKRVALCGAAETGKSTLVEFVTDRPIVHADDWRDFPFADQPSLVIEAVRHEPTFLIEGCLVARCLRKGLDADVLLWLCKPQAPQTERQKAQGKGLVTIFESIRDSLSIPIVVIP
jgi:hypothetical protein